MVPMVCVRAVQTRQRCSQRCARMSLCQPRHSWPTKTLISVFHQAIFYSCNPPAYAHVDSAPKTFLPPSCCEPFLCAFSPNIA
eukprot:5019707-Amphidinium_carterae.1